MNIKVSSLNTIKLLKLAIGWSQEKRSLNAKIDKTYFQNIEKVERNVSIL